MIAETKIRSERSLSANNKNDFTFWLIFGLSPNLGRRNRLSQKMKLPNTDNK